MTETKPVSTPTGEIDKTGETLTPEMASKEIIKEGEVKPNPEKPEEKPADAPADKPADKPEDVQKPEDIKPEDGKPADKPEDKKPDEPLQTKPRSIYDDLKDKKKENKEVKSENETLKAQLAEQDTLIKDLTDKAKVAETPAEKKEVSDEIKALAEEIGATPEGIAKLTDFITKIVKPAPASLSDEDKKALETVRQTEAQREAQAQFATEWNTFEPSLKTEFPHVSTEDLAVVKKEVDRLAHTQKYHDKEIDYIYFKEKQNLSKLISPKRPSYEGSDNKPTNDKPADVELSEKSSPMDVQKVTEKRSTSSLEIRSGQN